MVAGSFQSLPRRRKRAAQVWIGRQVGAVKLQARRNVVNSARKYYAAR